MRCEVVAVGTELLLGQITDTNSAWIGEQLALAGIDSYFQTRVGDNRARVAEVLRGALARADAVIVCGGLGPTPDDLTREAIAEVVGAELIRDPEVEERIRAMFGSRGRTMPANNLRQADVPAGATVIAQQPGTAPGLICPVGDKVIYAVPGVPYEMKEMLTGTVLADLQRRAGVSAVIRSRTLRTWGHSESGLAELLAPRIDELDQSGHATLAFLASGIEGLKVRVTVKADTAPEADATLDSEVSLLREVLGELIFSDDDESMEQVVLQLLAAQGLTLATAESMTGGLIASRLTAVPGASKVFRGSVVSYASDVKYDLLGVPAGPVVSGDAAEAMALGACRVLGADAAVAVTGVAGPDRQEGHPPGTVFLACAVHGEVDTLMVRLPGDREQIRQFAAISALDMLRRRLVGAGSLPPFTGGAPRRPAG